MMPAGKATSSLHTSVNPFSLWFNGLKQMKLHRETRCSLCESQNANTGRILALRYNIPGSHVLHKFKTFPALKFSLCSCGDMLNELLKYCNFLTVFSCAIWRFFEGPQSCWCLFTNLPGSTAWTCVHWHPEPLSRGNQEWHFVQHCCFHLGLWEHLERS